MALKSIEEKKIIIADFFEYLDRRDEEVLAGVKDIQTAIDALNKAHIPNGLIDRLKAVAKDFVASVDDPQICWKHSDQIESSAMPALRDLKETLDIRAGELLCAVGGKNYPEWFWELLQKPSGIPLGFREVFRKKAKDFLSSQGISFQ